VPLLWVIEDLHWADSLTRDWLLSTLAAVRDWPVLIVLTARPRSAGGHRLPSTST